MKTKLLFQSLILSAGIMSAELIHAQNPCQAGFSYWVDTSQSNLVYFNDFSTGGPFVGWYWNFGDGNNSTLQNPSHTYTNAGTYTVCLTVYSQTDTCIYCDTIANYPCNVQASFTFNSTNDPTVSFTNTSAGGNTSYWNFGDGNSSSSINPAHTYQYNGTYIACLYASDSLSGCYAVYCDSITITNATNPPCSANFTHYSDTTQQQGVMFYDQSAGNPVSWFWDFGDGNNSTLQNPVHQYAQAGTYSVCLTIVNSFNDTCTYCDSVNYYPCNLSPGFTFNSANDPQIVFTNTSTGGYQPYYYWNFGDGNNSSLLNPTHTYQYNGTYIVCLYVSDSLNWCYASYCDTITITNASSAPCNALFTYYVYTDTIQFPFDTIVAFQDQSTLNPVQWFWDFGDGNYDSTQNPTHQYAVSDTYYVCLTIVNQSGDTCTTCDSVAARLLTTGINQLAENNITLKNYPNPFSNSTTISYSLKEKADVNISVYNNVGMKITELENSNREAGSHQLEWNAENLNSGVYFLEIKSGGGVLSRKMILIK